MFNYQEIDATRLDYKLALEEIKPKNWPKSVSAFANSHGGYILFGVTNDTHQACRFVNDVLHIRKRIKNIFGSHPVEGSHGESVIASLPDSKLFGEVIEGIEGMAGVELLIIFSVAAFYLTVVAWCKGFDFLVPDTEFSQCFLKECQRLILTVSHLICKFKPIICLNTLNSIGEFFHYMFQKLCGGIGALLLECFKITEAAVFVDEGILIEFLSGSFSHKAGSGNIFHINLSPLSRIFHFFIRFGNVFGIGQFYRLPVNTAQELVQSGDGSGVSPLAQLHPEHYQTRMGIPAAHIPDQLDLRFCVLVWMAVRTM